MATLLLFRCLKSSVLVMLAMNAIANTETVKTAGVIPGEMDIQLSSFHELRGTFKDDDIRLKVRSKMSGAYDVNVRFSFDKNTYSADFDLVDESMLLDGGNNVLTESQKQAMTHARRHLIQYLQQEYEDQFPEHSFLAVQMLGYWSRAPKGFPIGRREIQTQNHSN